MKKSSKNTVTAVVLVLLVVAGYLAFEAFFRPKTGIGKASTKFFLGGNNLCYVGGTSKYVDEGIGGTLAAVLGEPLIRSTVSGLGNYVKTVSESASGEIRVAVTQADQHKYSLEVDEQGMAESNIECLVIVNGTSGLIDNFSLPSWLKSKDRLSDIDPEQLFVKITSEGNGEREIDIELLRTLRLLDVPESYFEFRIRNHPTANAFRLEPSIVYFRKQISDLRNGEATDVEATITLHRPSNSSSIVAPEERNSSFVLQIPVAIRGLALATTNQAESIVTETVWVALPSSPNEKTLQTAKNYVIESGVESVTFSPANAYLTYRETGEPSLFLSLVDNVLNDNKEKISEALIQSILVNERE